MDVKKLCRIPGGGGWRAHGRDKIARPPKAGRGFDYVHSLVDDHSRLAYSEILPEEKGHGKVERLNRTLQTEWAYRQPFTSDTERATALAPWIENYNTQRRHSALGGLPPISRLLPT